MQGEGSFCVTYPLGEISRCFILFQYSNEEKVTEKVISMALDLSQFDEAATCSLIDSLLQEENEEIKEDANHLNLSTECPTNGGLKPTLTGDSLSEQVNCVSVERRLF